MKIFLPQKCCMVSLAQVRVRTHRAAVTNCACVVNHQLLAPLHPVREAQLMKQSMHARARRRTSVTERWWVCGARMLIGFFVTVLPTSGILDSGYARLHCARSTFKEGIPQGGKALTASRLSFVVRVVRVRLAALLVLTLVSPVAGRLVVLGCDFV